MPKTIFTNRTLYFDILKPQSRKELNRMYHIVIKPNIWNQIIMALAVVNKKRFYKKEK